MKISLNWISNYVKIDRSHEDVVNDLIRIGYDIESVEKQGEKYKNFYVGKVLEKKKHPNADKLSVCTVRVFEDELNIVCGAPNVDKGQNVCVALAGAVIPEGNFEIKKSKIRGEVSEGMICSAKELGMGDDHTGIMVLNENAVLGTPFAEYLGMNDVIIDISLTANRGDLLSHLGIARELGYLYDNKLEIKDIEIDSNSNEKIEDHIEVIIENYENCNRYYGLLLKDVKIKESPDWLRNYLQAVGQRSINNVVDITNFVMLECGQPLHAFDYRDISDKKIIVKDFGKTGTFKTLDSKDRQMMPDILMINDAVKPIGIAGIMGGENSEIKDDTTTVFIESAFFNPLSIRKSSKFLGLQSDSSYRFERGVDVDMVPWSCRRAAKLLIELADAIIVKGYIDNYKTPLEKNIVELRIERLNSIAGFEIDKNEAISILDKIGIKLIIDNNSSLKFEIPNHRRFDLQQEIDLIEEIIRLKGYDNIPNAASEQIRYDLKDYSNQTWDYVNNIKGYLGGRGFKEIITDTLIKEENAIVFNDDIIKLKNPFSNDMNVLRTNLTIGALQTIKFNLNHKLRSYKLFEIGSVFMYKDDVKNYYEHIFENRYILLTLAGEYDHEALNIKPRYFDLLDLKGEFKALLEKLNVENYNINYYNYKTPIQNSIDFDNNGNIFAKLYNLDKGILKNYDIDVPVYFCEIDLKALKGLSDKKIGFKEFSKYPPVLRDISFLTDKNVKVKDIEQVMEEVKSGLLKEVKLYDIYQPDNSDKKSYTYSLVFLSREKTLTDEEVNKVQDKIIKNLQNKIKAELRK